MTVPNFAIRRGQAFAYEGVRIRYSGRARNARGDYLFVQDDRVQVCLDGAELSRLREANELPDWTEPRAAADGREVRPLTMLGATDARRADAQRRLDYCMSWAERPQTPKTELGLAPLVAEVDARRKIEAAVAKRFEPPAPCPSSVRNWITKWQAGSCVADALLTRERDRGNRSRRFSLHLAGLLADFVQENYLTEQRLSVAEVHRRLEADIERRNKKGGEPLDKPSYEAVKAEVDRLCPFTVDFCRTGPRFAEEKWRAVGSGYVTERPNQVWELDDTRADIICVSEDGSVIGRPWITVVIDRHTRMIMSFVFSFHPPDTMTAMEALRVAIKSKQEILERHGLAGLGYPAQGRPDFVHVDNAKHYNSKALKLALNELGIQHRTMPVLKAWFRAIVERAIGTLSRQVFHVVPGTTYAGIYERDKERAPEKVAEATRAEVEAKLWTWVVSGYARQKHKGIEDTPLSAWMRYVRAPGNEMRLTLPGEKVDAALSLTVARKPRKEGLQASYLLYNSEHVARLRLRTKAEGALDEVVTPASPADPVSVSCDQPRAWRKALTMNASLAWVSLCLWPGNVDRIRSDPGCIGRVALRRTPP